LGGAGFLGSFGFLGMGKLSKMAYAENKAHNDKQADQVKRK
jgi:hypothetical protein